MSLIDDREEKIESAGKFWLALFSSAWILFLLYLILVQHGFCLGAILLPFSGFVIKRLATPSELMARVQVPLTEQAENAFQKNAQSAAVKRFTKEEQERRKHETITSAASEVVKRLGVIEGYIRVLRVKPTQAAARSHSRVLTKNSPKLPRRERQARFPHQSSSTPKFRLKPSRPVTTWLCLALPMIP